jgi:ABC-type tungstate transport system substrate-binding protein
MAIVTATPMDPLHELGKALLIFGIVLACAGAFLLIGGKLPLRLGHLPGDISYQGRNGNFYFPIVTCLLLSVGLTLLFWIVNLFRR